jgi:hypothetical protein
MWYRVVWQIGANVSEELLVAIFMYPYDGGRISVRNAGTNTAWNPVTAAIIPNVTLFILQINAIAANMCFKSLQDRRDVNNVSWPKKSCEVDRRESLGKKQPRLHETARLALSKLRDTVTTVGAPVRHYSITVWASLMRIMKMVWVSRQYYLNVCMYVCILFSKQLSPLITCNISFDRMLRAEWEAIPFFPRTGYHDWSFMWISSRKISASISK